MRACDCGTRECVANGGDTRCFRCGGQIGVIPDFRWQHAKSKLLDGKRLARRSWDNAYIEFKPTEGEISKWLVWSAIHAKQAGYYTPTGGDLIASDWYVVEVSDAEDDEELCEH